MAGNVSLNTVTDGLVLYLDAANTKSLPNLVTNQFLWSQDFTNVSWIRSRMTTSGSTMAAPYGSSSATTLTATLSYSAIRQNITVPIGIYTVSYYVKYINQQFMTIVHEGIPLGTATFDLINGTTTGVGGTSGFGVSALITAAPNGFYRISVTFNVTQPSFVLAANLWFGAYNGNDNTGSQVYVWGAQFENGSSPTTYLPTTSTYASNITTWNDLSKNTNNGTLINNPTFNNTNGGSIVFDGVNDYANIPSSPELEITSDLTINIWIYNTLPKSGIGIITKGPLSGDYDYMIYLTSNSTNLNFYKKNSSGVDASGGGFVTTILNTWVNVCFTKQGTTVKGYENGVLRKTDIFTDSNIRTSSNSLKIGNGWTPAFGGKIPQTQVYNRALSAQEVLQNYNATKSRFGL